MASFGARHPRLQGAGRGIQYGLKSKSTHGIAGGAAVVGGAVGGKLGGVRGAAKVGGAGVAGAYAGGAYGGAVAGAMHPEAFSKGGHLNTKSSNSGHEGHFHSAKNMSGAHHF